LYCLIPSSDLFADASCGQAGEYCTLSLGDVVCLGKCQDGVCDACGQVPPPECRQPCGHYSMVDPSGAKGDCVLEAAHGQQCSSGTCCGSECCGNSLCCFSADKQTCCKPGETCCKGSCCESGKECCNGGCCDIGQTCCNNQCCNGKCEDGVCNTCKTDETLCGGNCCKSGQVCCGGRCCDGECKDGVCQSSRSCAHSWNVHCDLATGKLSTFGDGSCCQNIEANPNDPVSCQASRTSCDPNTACVHYILISGCCVKSPQVGVNCTDPEGKAGACECTARNRFNSTCIDASCVPFTPTATPTETATTSSSPTTRPSPTNSLVPSPTPPVLSPTPSISPSASPSSRPRYY
jgi:hypothetical protein